MYALLDENNIVVQIQPNEQEGFVEVDNSVICGMIFNGTEFVAPEINYDWETVRIKRNAMLAKSDWTQVFDSPLSAEQKEEWAAYRQTLRDITEEETANEAMIILNALPKPSN